MGNTIVSESVYTAFATARAVRALNRRYPFINVDVMGESAMGKPLYALSMGEGPALLCVSAAHHANEWITAPVVLRFLEDYAAAYARDGDIFGVSAAALFAAVTLYIVPMVDPDGVDLVTGALSAGPFFERARAMAQSYPDIPFPSGWKANIEGTDLNLNYPAGWEEARRIKAEQGYDRPGPRDYVGPAPLSAPESRALYAYTAARPFRMVLAFHTQGEVIFWNYLDQAPANAYTIGQQLAAASGYALADTPYNSAFAGYKDWFIDAYGRPGYTVEAGLGTNPLPISQFPAIYAACAPLLVAAMQAV